MYISVHIVSCNIKVFRYFKYFSNACYLFCYQILFTIFILVSEWNLMSVSNMLF